MMITPPLTSNTRSNDANRHSGVVRGISLFGVSVTTLKD